MVLGRQGAAVERGERAAQPLLRRAARSEDCARVGQPARPNTVVRPAGGGIRMPFGSATSRYYRARRANRHP